MTPSFEERLTQVLDREAERVGADGLVADLGPTVVRRGRAVRRRRRAVGAAAVAVAAAAVALAVPSGTVRTTPAPDIATSPSPAPSARPDAIGPLQLADLRRGPAPRVPRVLDGVLYDGSRRIALGTRDVAHVIKLPSGSYLVRLWNSSGGQVRTAVLRVDPDGTRTTIDDKGPIGEMAVDASGSRVAWARESFAAPGDSPSSELFVADIATGDVTARATAPFGGTVVGWLGGRVLLGRVHAEEGWVWTPGPNTVTRLLRDILPTGVDAASGTIAGRQFRGDPQRSCGVVVRAGDPSRHLWDSCDSQPGGQFSPDGRHVLGVPADSIVEGLSRYTVLDVLTGAPRLSVEANFKAGAVWEDDRTFLVSVGDGGLSREAIVRCTTDGSCELASDIVTTNVPAEEAAFLLGTP